MWNITGVILGRRPTYWLSIGRAGASRRPLVVRYGTLKREQRTASRKATGKLKIRQRTASRKPQNYFIDKLGNWC